MRLTAQGVRMALLAGGLLGGAWGLQEGIPWLMSAGMCALGASLAWDGAHALSLTPWRPSEPGSYAAAYALVSHTASAALEAAAGAVLLALALTATMTGWESLAEYVRVHPGWLGIAAGLAMVRGGLGVVLSPQPAAQRASQRVRAALERLTGLPSITIGGLLIVAGGVQVLMPGAITHWLQAWLGGSGP